MNLNIFTDFHHYDLFYSLHLLFEKRLNCNLFSPVGLDWFKEGYWLIGDPYPNPLGTAIQYLEIRNHHQKKEGIYYLFRKQHNFHEKLITLEKFKEMEFDIIMPTFPGHERVYEKLRNLFQPKAKLISQIGNAGQRTHLPNVLHSSAYPNPLPYQNCVFYHQEIDPNLFKWTPPSRDTSNIYSVVNLAPDVQSFNIYKNIIKEANWKYYGAGSPDGPVPGARGVSEKMKESNIGFHVKQGVGHSTRGWFSVGRPILTRMHLHKKAGGDTLKLFEPGVTCVDLDAHTIHENVKIIRSLLDPDKGYEWACRVRKRFEDIINYDRDEHKIRTFLQRLK